MATEALRRGEMRGGDRSFWYWV